MFRLNPSGHSHTFGIYIPVDNPTEIYESIKRYYNSYHVDWSFKKLTVTQVVMSKVLYNLLPKKYHSMVNMPTTLVKLDTVGYLEPINEALNELDLYDSSVYTVDPAIYYIKFREESGIIDDIIRRDEDIPQTIPIFLDDSHPISVILRAITRYITEDHDGPDFLQPIIISDGDILAIYDGRGAFLLYRIDDFVYGLLLSLEDTVTLFPENLTYRFIGMVYETPKIDRPSHIYKEIEYYRLEPTLVADPLLLNHLVFTLYLEHQKRKTTQPL